MITEYIIQDASVKYMQARNPLEEGLFYTGNTWIRDFQKAKKYTDLTTAINEAKELYKELPVKVLSLQIEGNRVGVGVINL